MTAETLRSVVRNFTSLSKEETDALQSLTSDSPYCQVFHMLLARSSKDLGRPDQKDRLHTAAVYATDRAVLKLVMTTPMRARVEIAPKLSAPPVPVAPVLKVPPLRDASRLGESSGGQAGTTPREPSWTEVSGTTVATKKTEPVKPAQPVAPAPASFQKQVINLEGDALRADLIKELTKLQKLKHEFEESYERFIHSGPLIVAQKPRGLRAPRDHSGSEATGATPRETSVATPKEAPAVPASSTAPIEGEPLIEEIKTSKRKPKLVSPKVAEQGEIIDNFIKVAPTLPRAKASESAADLSEDSVNYGDNIVSETLVEILLKQGKKAKAIEMLKKLIWKFPQKKAYFAAQIEALKG